MRMAETIQIPISVRRCVVIADVEPPCFVQGPPPSLPREAAAPATMLVRMPRLTILSTWRVAGRARCSTGILPDSRDLRQPMHARGWERRIHVQGCRIGFEPLSTRPPPLPRDRRLVRQARHWRLPARPQARHLPRALQAVCDGKRANRELDPVGRSRNAQPAHVQPTSRLPLAPAPATGALREYLASTARV